MARAERDLPEQSGQTERVKWKNISIGIYTPEKYITNEEFEQRGIITKGDHPLTAVNIEKQTGIKRRYRAGENESVVNMGVKAARAAGDLKDIYAVFASTSYPIGKNVSHTIGYGLELHPMRNRDFYGACSGSMLIFAYMKENEEEFKDKKVLVIATEKYSPTLVDLRDPASATLDPSMAETIFSDRAAAMVFRYGKDIRVLGSGTKTINLSETFENCIRMPIDRTLMVEPYTAIPVSSSASGKFEQDGRSVIRGLKSNVSNLNKTVVKNAGLQASDIKLVIPHQSIHVINTLSQEMPEFAEDKFVRDLQDGNSSSASIIIALARAMKEGRVQDGDNHLWSSFGAGKNLFACSVAVRLGESSNLN